MRCSATTFVLTVISFLSSVIFTLLGYKGLNDTLDLLKQYGPKKGYGNPALDVPSDENLYQSSSDYKPTNIPYVFGVVQNMMIFMVIFMGLNSLLFMWDSVRSKKMFCRDPTLSNKDSVVRKMSCSSWLTGYSVFLALIWLIITSLSCLPLIEWKLTERRCNDLHSNKWHDKSVYREICVDLLQLGLINFRDQKENFYGLICAYKGEVKPSSGGDLNSLCDNYYSTYSLFVIASVCATINMLIMVLFAVLHAVNYTHIKERRMHFIIMNGMNGTVPMLPPQHQAILQDQLIQLSTNPMPHNTLNSHRPRRLSSTYLLNNTVTSMDTVAEEDAMIGSGDIEMQNLSLHNTMGRTSRASKYKPSRAPSTATVNGTMAVYEKRDPLENDSLSIDRRYRRRNGSYRPEDLVYEDEEARDEEDKKRCPSEDFSDDYQNVAPPATAGVVDETSEPEYDTMRSAKSCRNPRINRQLSRKRRNRGAQSDTDISRHIDRRRRQSSQRRTNRQSQRRFPAPSTIDDEYDSPPSDFYDTAEFQRADKRNAYV